MNAISSPLLRHWPIAALVVSAAMLATAHGFETFGGLAPCNLCLRQREIYWLAMGVAAVGVLAALAPPGLRLPALACALLALVFLGGAAIAVYHAGVEWKRWPGPSTCTGARGGVSPDALAALMHGARISAPRCDQAAWRWLGLSMAGWNALISLGLAALSGLAAYRSLRHDQG